MDRSVASSAILLLEKRKQAADGMQQSITCNLNWDIVKEEIWRIRKCTGAQVKCILAHLVLEGIARKSLKWRTT